MVRLEMNNYSLNFFGSINGDFNVSPQSYHAAWRKQSHARKAFMGPWDYAGKSAAPIVDRMSTEKSKFVSPQEQFKSATVQRGGFISPVNDIFIGKTRTYSFGVNRTQALSEE